MKQTNVRFHDLEAEIATSMRVTAQKAAHAAATGRPSTRQAVIFMYRGCHQSAQSVIDTINFRLQVMSGNFAAKRGLVHREAEQARLENMVATGEDRAIGLSGYAKAATGAGTRILLSILLVALCVGDSIWNQRGFEMLFQLNYITSLIVAVVVASVLAYLAHEAVPKYVRAADGDYRKRMGAVMALAAAVFLLLGIVRMDGLPKDMGWVLKVAAFTLMSSISYLAACLIGIRLLESKSTAATEQEAQAAEELREVRGDVKQAKADLAKLKKDSEESRAYAAALTEYGMGLKQRVVNDAHGIFYDYLKAAFNGRDAETDPDIFDFPEYPFDFVTEIVPPGREKNRTGTVPLLLLCAVLGLTVSCGGAEKPDGDMAVTVLVDNSTHLPGYPDGPGLMHFTGLDRNIWQGVRIDVGKISDVDYEPTHTHILETAARWESNLERRTDTVAYFSDAVSQSLMRVIPPADAELDRSVVYRTVARHAVELLNMRYTRKYLLVWSDLMNNDGQVSFYGKSGRALLQKPEELEKKFAEQVPLGDLSGITVIFIHRPDGKTNDGFVAAGGFFGGMFSRHGAEVKIAASLPNP